MNLKYTEYLEAIGTILAPDVLHSRLIGKYGAESKDLATNVKAMRSLSACVMCTLLYYNVMFEAVAYSMIFYGYYNRIFIAVFLGFSSRYLGLVILALLPRSSHKIEGLLVAELFVCLIVSIVVVLFFILSPELLLKPC